MFLLMSYSRSVSTIIIGMHQIYPVEYTSIRFRRRYRDGEILQHQVSLFRVDPERGGAGGHGESAEDARRRAEGGGWQTAGRNNFV